MADSGIFPAVQPPYLDSSLYPDYLDMQRKQMLAQALMQNAMQSTQTPAGWDSMRVVPRRSALSTITPLVGALLGRKAWDASQEAQQNYFQKLYPNQPAPSQSSAATPPQGVDSQASGAPIPPNGVPGSQGPPSRPQAAPAQLNSAPAAPAAAPVSSSNPMLLTGDPRTSQALLGMMGPQEYAKALAGRYAPTDMEKMLRAAGIDPASAIGQSALLRAVGKANYIAPIEEREGAVERDPLTNQVIGENPKTPMGGVNFYDAQGNLTGQGLAPGAAKAISGSKAAETAGTVSQTPVKVGVDAQGRDVLVYPTPPALSASGPSGPTRTPGVTGSGASDASTPQKAAQPSTASKAVLSAQEEGGKSGQAYSADLAKNATGATEIRRSLSELKNLSRQATPAAMNEGKMRLGSYMIAAGVSPETTAKWLGVDVGALQAAAKQTSTLAVGVIHSMTSRGTNFDLDTFMRNNPNLNMSDPSAFQKVVDYMDNKAKQEIAKQKDFVQWKKGVSPDEWEAGHTAHWLDQQNQLIDAGKTNSRPPLASFMRQ